VEVEEMGPQTGRASVFGVGSGAVHALSASVRELGEVCSGQSLGGLVQFLHSLYHTRVLYLDS